MSDSLWPHESQHSRPPCPSPTPGVHSDSHPSSQWCHPAISSSVVPFSSCPQSLPASESFPMSQFFASGGQSIGVLASVFQWIFRIFFRVNWFDLLAVPGTLEESSPTPQFKSINSLVLSFPYSPPLTSIRDYWKNHSFEASSPASQFESFYLYLLYGHEFEWTPGVGDGHGGLACCDSWGCKESDMTERLNWTEYPGLTPS